MSISLKVFIFLLTFNIKIAFNYLKLVVMWTYEKIIKIKNKVSDSGLYLPSSLKLELKSSNKASPQLLQVLHDPPSMSHMV